MCSGLGSFDRGRLNKATATSHGQTQTALEFGPFQQWTLGTTFVCCAT